MKNKIFVFLLLGIFSFIAMRPIHQPELQALSSKEMSVIQGGDCDPGTLEAYKGLATFFSFVFPPLAIYYGVLYLTELSKCGGSGGGGSNCTDPCPNGGGSEIGWACDNNGGRSTGTPVCGAESNYVCCVYE